MHFWTIVGMEEHSGKVDARTVTAPTEHDAFTTTFDTGWLLIAAIKGAHTISTPQNGYARFPGTPVGAPDYLLVRKPW